jgi:hypothetical protein
MKEFETPFRIIRFKNKDYAKREDLENLYYR